MPMPDPAHASNSHDKLRDFTADHRVLILAAMAVVVGSTGALAAWVLSRLINFVTNLAYFGVLSGASVTIAGNHLGPASILIPVVGCLIIGLMARYGSEKIRGHGIPEAIEAILIGRSRIQARVALLKPLSSAISIGTGGPFGAEGPIIMTGGALGSLFAQLFHLSNAERKTLLVAGAAAGMTATFGTPIAAILLAVELLLFEWKPRSFVPVAAACVVAYLLRAPLLGAGPIFPVASHDVLNASELGVALLVGIAAGLGSALLTALVYGAEDIFAKLPMHYMWWPVIGGAVVGLGGLLQPRALGVGYDTIRDLLSGHLIGAFVLGLLVTKAVIWSVALGSGTSGGVLAPLLIMGGALGAIEARWIHIGDPALWAMISMAAMMGGTMRSPLTAIAFLLELTHDVELLPGLLVGCVAAHAVTVLLMKRSILTEKVARRGYHVVREYSVSPLSRFRVADVMERDVPTIPADICGADIVRRLVLQDPVFGRRHSWPLVDDKGALVGILTRADLLQALNDDDEDDRTMLEIGTASPVVAYPDDQLEDALNLMLRASVGRLPVVDRNEPGRLLGMLSRGSIATAYRSVLDEEHEVDRSDLSARIRLMRQRLLRGTRAAAR